MPLRFPRLPHRWDLTPRAAIAVQRRLARRIVLNPPGAPFRWIAGLDATFAEGGMVCVAAVVLWDRHVGEVVESHLARRPVRFPYVPGLLTFREAPALLSALRLLSKPPDVLLCDGHGTAHPRNMGIASHVGLLTGVPSVGCAKGILVGTCLMPGRRRGSTTPLLHNGIQIGQALRTQSGIRPVYVSPGHLADQDTARELVLGCSTRYRLPEPTRLAEAMVGQARRA